MKYKAILVDDEKFAREDVKTVLADFDDIIVVGEAEKLSDAKKLCNELKPDILFLDVRLKGELGFELLSSIEKDIKVIFITAYDEYAVRAFEVNALDYLVKPVNPERLRLTLEKLETAENIGESENPLQIDDSIFIMLNHQHQFLKIRDIIVISAASDYTEIITTDRKKHLTSKSMKEWEERLPERNFCRIHRSTIVNLEYIDSVEEWFNQAYSIKIKGIEKPFTMSRNYASRIKKLLS